MIDVDKIRHDIRHAGHDFTVERNHLTEHPSPEYRRRHLGALPDPALQGMRLASLPMAGAPPTVYTPSPLMQYATQLPVYQQASCGACMAFSVCHQVNAMTAIEHRDSANYVAVSPMDPFFCCSSLPNMCETGAYPSQIYDYAVANGLDAWADDPYIPVDQPCKIKSVAMMANSVKIDSYSLLMDLVAIKAHLDTVGPMTVIFTVFSDFYGYSGGTYHRTSDVVEGAHAVCMFDLDIPGNRALFENSWGETWGMVGPNGKRGWCWIGLGEGYFLLSGAYGVSGVTSKTWNLPMGQQHINPPPPPPISDVPVITSPANNATGVPLLPTVTWRQPTTFVPVCNWVKIGHASSINHSNDVLDSGLIHGASYTPTVPLPPNTPLQVVVTALNGVREWHVAAKVLFTTGSS